MNKVTLSEIEVAKRVLGEVLDPTPLVPNRWLSEKYGCKVYLKLENMQPIGSFKIRGAAYKISKLDKKQKARGVVASSAGNHAQGVAWAANHFGMKATIVMPTTAPITKVLNTKALGAKVVLFGDNYEQTYEEAMRLKRKMKATFVHPYEDEHVIAGQGTIGLEILEQLPDVDMVIGAIGGGGMMAGTGAAIKAHKPKVQVVGAQASGARSMIESLKKHKVVQTGMADTFADGIRVKKVSPVMFKALDEVMDLAVHADDETIAESVLTLMEKAKVIAEGAGALPLAILDKLSKESPAKIRNKKVVLIVCGGNIDVNLVSRIIDHGLTHSGRRIRVNISVPDKPGSLQLLTKLIAENGANIIQAIHDRDAPSIKLSETSVQMTLETRGADHAVSLVDTLKKEFPKTELFS